MDAQLLHMAEDICLVIVEDDAAINLDFTEACGRYHSTLRQITTIRAFARMAVVYADA